MNRRRDPVGSWHGVAAAALGLAAVEGVAAAAGARSFVDAAGQLVVDHGPRPVVEHTVNLFKTVDKPVIRAAVAGTVLGVGGLLGRLPRAGGRDAALVAAVATLGAATSRRRPAVASPSDEQQVTAFAAVAGGLATLCALRAARLPDGLIFVAGLAGLLAAERGYERRQVRQDNTCRDVELLPVEPLPPARDGAEQWQGVSPLLTPLGDFYVTDANMRPPLVDLGSWRLDITGAVHTPRSLRYRQLAGLDLVEFDAAMVCVHNRLGWNRLGNQRWIGYPLLPLLETAGPIDGAKYLVTRAVDGWECSLPLQLLRETDAFVVLGMAGRSLTAAHGFPARVFVPGLYGQYTGAKWLTELRLQSEPNKDYWLPRGWPHGPAPVRPLSRIDTPVSGSRLTGRHLDVAGVAWAPPHGVEAVEIALDDQPWVLAELAAELAPAAWRRWRAHLPVSAGEHRVRVRCISRAAGPQEAVPRLPFPTGASGHHSLRLVVE